MTIHQRAAQVWSILAWAATNRQTLTYEMVGRLTGLAAVGVGNALDPIQNYCASERLPPLTALVVLKGTGAPSDGFIAAADAPAAQGRVFEFDWLGHGNPGPDAFRDAPQIEG